MTPPVSASTTLERPLGILGGTFDPVHIGHIRLGIEARECLDLAAVHYVPLAEPNHRNPATATPAERLAMLEASLDGEQLVADDREVRRGGVSYTIDTLVSFREEIPATPLILLLGQDAFAGLLSWHRWNALLDYCHIVVVTRVRDPLPLEPPLQALVEQAQCGDPAIMHSTLNGHVYFQTIPLLPISSTDIRARLADGRSIEHLVAPSVATYITRQGLYLS